MIAIKVRDDFFQTLFVYARAGGLDVNELMTMFLFGIFHGRGEVLPDEYSSIAAEMRQLRSNRHHPQRGWETRAAFFQTRRRTISPTR